MRQSPKHSPKVHECAAWFLDLDGDILYRHEDPR